MRRRLLVLFLAAVLAVAAEASGVSSGFVIRKEHEEATKRLMVIPITVGKVTIMSQYWIHDDEDWALLLEDCTMRGCRQGWVYVTKETFEATIVGDYYRVGSRDEQHDEHERLGPAHGD